MSKNLRFVGAALATAAIALGPIWTPARAGDSASYTYVATEIGGAITDPRDTPAGTIAPGGGSEFTATGSTVSLHVDDRMALDGQAIHLYVGTKEKGLFFGCMPVRRIVTLSGTRPGQRVWVSVGLFDWGTPVGPCSGRATTGVVTISGVLDR